MIAKQFLISHTDHNNTLMTSRWRLWKHCDVNKQQVHVTWHALLSSQCQQFSGSESINVMCNGVESRD